jgi:hypothetical protein
MVSCCKLLINLCSQSADSLELLAGMDRSPQLRQICPNFRLYTISINSLFMFYKRLIKPVYIFTAFQSHLKPPKSLLKRSKQCSLKYYISIYINNSTTIYASTLSGSYGGFFDGDVTCYRGGSCLLDLVHRLVDMPIVLMSVFSGLDLNTTVKSNYINSTALAYYFSGLG